MPGNDAASKRDMHVLGQHLIKYVLAPPSIIVSIGESHWLHLLCLQQVDSIKMSWKVAISVHQSLWTVMGYCKLLSIDCHYRLRFDGVCLFISLRTLELFGNALQLIFAMAPWAHILRGRNLLGQAPTHTPKSQILDRRPPPAQPLKSIFTQWSLGSGPKV